MSFGEQLGGEGEVQTTQLNKYGEPRVTLKPKPPVQAEIDENQDLQCEWWDAFFLRPEEGAAKRFE